MNELVNPGTIGKGHRLMRHAALALLIVIGSASLGLAAEAARPAERRVTLRVKDGAASHVIRELQKQCGVKNVVIDRDVAGQAAFYLSNVPCEQAWSVVLKTYGLEATSYSGSVLHVETRH